jgi:C1A family cysteine protease
MAVRINLDELAATLRQEEAPWESGETSMTALSEDQLQVRLGFTPPPGAATLEEVDRELRNGLPHLPFTAAAAVGAPASYDLRNVNGQSYVTGVRDQGSCGSCVAFGTVAVLESSLKIAAGNPALTVDLSEAHLFYCHGRRQGRRCATGWWPEAALDACREQGLAFEQSYPYVAGDADCTGLDASWKNRYVSLTGRRQLSGAQIKEWIATRGPVTGCFIVYSDFFAYRSGVYRHVSGEQVGGHCVALIGYDDSQNCWIAKNSWGTGWGENGFFRIAYGECGIDSWYGPFGAEGVAIQEQSEKAWSGWASEAGVLTSDIAIGDNADGRMELFVRGTDGAVWHKWQTAPSNGWSDWASEGGVITSNIAIGRNADGRLEMFVRGTDNALWHKWQVAPNSGWSDWASEGGVLTSDIAIAANADGRLEMFVRGTDGAVWHKWQVAPSGGWSDWQSLGGVITSNITLGRNADGRLELFARGTDNALWHKWQVAPNSGWSDWATQGGVLTSDIAVSNNADGRMEVFVRGTDGAVWHKWQVAPSSGWSDWDSLGGVITSNIAVGRSPNGRMELFVRGTDGAVWHKWQTAPNNGWSDWASEGGVITSNIAVGRNADGRLEVFARGTDNALWHNWQTRVFAERRLEATETKALPKKVKAARRVPVTPAETYVPQTAQKFEMPTGAMTYGGQEMPTGDMYARSSSMPRGEMQSTSASMPKGGMSFGDVKPKQPPRAVRATVEVPREEISAAARISATALSSAGTNGKKPTRQDSH